MKKLLILSAFVLCSNFSFAQTTPQVFDEFSKLKKTEVIAPDYTQV